MMKNLSLLVILAHPDDESFPMGGTLAKYATAGVNISLVCATRGEAGIPGMVVQEAGILRERELRSAATILGIQKIHFLGIRDGKLPEADPDLLVSQLQKIFLDVHPQAIITFGPDGISGHPDHVTISKLVTEAFDLAIQKGILSQAARLFYIAPSEATQQGCGVVPSVEQAGGPVAAIDVEKYLVKKVQAMQSHASQNPPFVGKPGEEATRLTCHEYFTLVRPRANQVSSTDLFFTEPSIHWQGDIPYAATYEYRD